MAKVSVVTRLTIIIIVGSLGGFAPTIDTLAVQSSDRITEDADEFYEGTMENLSIIDDQYLSLDRVPVDPFWKNVTALSSIQPSGCVGHSMVYIPNSDKVILFGGQNISFSLCDETWVYNLTTNTWIQINPPVMPNGRAGHSMVYVPSSNKVILFGGIVLTESNDTEYISDTWAYDMKADIWTRQHPPTSPIGRSFYSMVYCPNTNQVLLFGGYDENGEILNETWVYDLTANNWIQKNPSSKPSGRVFHSMIYAPSSDKVILFGGLDRNGYCGDTWAYDLIADNWTQLLPSTSPSARQYHSMVYNAHADQALLFGGYSTDVGLCNDTWVYNQTANNWIQIYPSGYPSGRAYHRMVYVGNTGQVMLYGGYNGTALLQDTWIYRDSAYCQSGSFESKLTSINLIYNITGEFAWNPSTQPVGTELRFQAGLSNTTKDEDVYYTDYYTSDFNFSGLARYLKYRVIFESDVNQIFSPRLNKVDMSVTKIKSYITTTGFFVVIICSGTLVMFIRKYKKT